MPSTLLASEDLGQKHRSAKRPSTAAKAEVATTTTTTTHGVDSDDANDPDMDSDSGSGSGDDVPSDMAHDPEEGFRMFL